MEPKFPTELEEVIFNLAALLHPSSMTALLLVAQRVRTWIQPLLYSVVCRHPFASIERLLASQPKSFLRDNVRYIRFPGSCAPHFLGKLLSICSASVDVVLPMLGMPADILTLLQPLPLQRLIIWWMSAFPIKAKRQMIVSCRSFTHLTHLEIRDWREHDEGFGGWEGIALIPNLTHLCFHELHTMIFIIMMCLHHNKSLQVLVVSCSTPSHMEFMKEPLDNSWGTAAHDPRFLLAINQPPVTDDPRFLLLLVPDYFHDMGWEARLRGGEDFWDVADRHVRKRRSGATNDYFATLED
ncbi:hypothetical protein C8R47DRAFT_171047 [Mycena vitilis]|nr:hypothetical protein C8R47DRAFT_171047 [Mycena vitilis]